GLHRLWLPLVGAQRLVRLIQADLGALRVIGSVVNLQHVFHSGDELAIRLAGDTPLALQPRLEIPLLSTCRTVSWETLSTWPSSTIRLARSRNAQRLRPSGAWLQASAIRWASPSPSSLFGARRSCFFLSSARESPPSTKRRRTRVTVSSATSSASTIAALVQPGAPSLSSAF